MDNKIILLFDGICNLCNRWVQFILRRNKSRSIIFASLQSSSGQKLLKDHHLPQQDFDSLIVFFQGKVYKKSQAVFILVKQLDFPWSLLGVFKIIPKILSDKVYDLIAQSRYKIFGKKDECMVPDESLKDRFLL
ncbi:MAG: thiol-disulfide oxidoreductase [Epsilonproteobacteria bacterium]|nr:MAG: thiol-disulfide oxidoreductase [Campylobacterota bacterium]RLA65905.1 MAG: thiol-disulfide oxidoreductase [Campylobacterota bacterium]